MVLSVLRSDAVQHVVGSSQFKIQRQARTQAAKLRMQI
jgi:hypothetical protein